MSGNKPKSAILREAVSSYREFFEAHADEIAGLGVSRGIKKRIPEIYQKKTPEAMKRVAGNVIEQCRIECAANLKGKKKANIRKELLGHIADLHDLSMDDSLLGHASESDLKAIRADLFSIFLLLKPSEKKIEQMKEWEESFLYPSLIPRRGRFDKRQKTERRERKITLNKLGKRKHEGRRKGGKDADEFWKKRKNQD